VARVVLTLNGLAVLALGIIPGPLLNVCLHAMHQIFGA